MSKFDPRRPITVGNCPTRAALERKPGDTGFLVESIHATHSPAKRANHARNLANRQAGAKPKAPKVAK